MPVDQVAHIALATSGPNDDHTVPWCETEETYLYELAAVCRLLSQRYNDFHHKYRARQNRVRVPIIAVSSVGGMISFGITLFPMTWREWVNVFVGICGMVVALAGSIESFLKISEIISGSLTASINLEKLAEHITLELSMPRGKRNTQGIVFVRSSYGTFEKYIESAPAVVDKIVFLKPPALELYKPSVPIEAEERRRHSITLDRISEQIRHKVSSLLDPAFSRPQVRAHDKKNECVSPRPTREVVESGPAAAAPDGNDGIKNDGANNV